jgi:hypothetical protein
LPIHHARLSEIGNEVLDAGRLDSGQLLVSEAIHQRFQAVVDCRGQSRVPLPGRGAPCSGLPAREGERRPLARGLEAALVECAGSYCAAQLIQDGVCFSLRVDLAVGPLAEADAATSKATPRTIELLRHMLNWAVGRELLALIDALRDGRARERQIAERELSARLRGLLRA